MKDRGLYKKYQVTKLTNPEKNIDAIVLEFDDKLSRVALIEYAKILSDNGYSYLASDILCKVEEYNEKEIEEVEEIKYE